MAGCFFDEYSRFYETTGTRLLPNRFQQRWRMIIDQNKAALQGARVLDIASHDGRWSFAALKAGAVYVEGVEARPQFVHRARETFRYYRIPDSAYSFQCQDAVQYLAGDRLAKFDVVFNLGFFYHTLKHLEILENMARTQARFFIIDTDVVVAEAPSVQIRLENASDVRNAIDHRHSGTAAVPVGVPTRSALKLMLDYVGYDVGEINWPAHVTDFAECEEYRAGDRGTFLATRRPSSDTPEKSSGSVVPN